MIATRLRFAAGLAILAALAAFGAVLAPVYWRNHQFSESLGPIAAEGLRNPDDWVRTAVVRSAAARRLPVSPSDVKVKRRDGRVEVEVPYTVLVDFSLYSVELHFRPEARR